MTLYNVDITRMIVEHYYGVEAESEATVIEEIRQGLIEPAAVVGIGFDDIQIEPATLAEAQP